jgi:hypothetical protein
MANNISELDSFQNNSGPKSLPNATAVLVLGILSIVGCFCYCLPGLIMGIISLVLHAKDKELYSSDPISYEASFKNSKAGYICAIIGVILSAIGFILVAISLVANGGNLNYRY